MARRILRPLVSRLRDARTRLLAPEARTGAEQWQRVVLNREVDRHLTGLGPAKLSAAEISGDAHSTRPWRQYVSLDYPEFDLCAPLRTPEQYDVVICEQVIEHVIDPRGAAENLRRLAAPGGHVIVSTPFLVRVHELPAYGLPDYWRFTPRGLHTLLAAAGLEVTRVGAWGNRSCVVGNFDHWPAYRRWHSLRSEPDLPVQVWAFARNPG